MKKLTPKEAEKKIKKGAKKISEDDLRKVIEKQKKIEEKFKKNGSLDKFVGDIKLLFSIIKDYINGVYKEIPFWSLAAVTFALLYVINPIDLIPDFIPFVGYVDDALVIATCLKMIKKDLDNYKEWKENNS